MEDPSHPKDSLDALTEQIAALRQTVDEMAGRQQRLAEAYTEFVPIVKEAMEYGSVRLADLESRGYFSAGQAALGVLDRVVSAYDADELERFGDSVVSILDTVRALTQPEVLAIANEATQVLHHADDIAPLKLGGMVKASRDADVQRGMAVMMEVLRHVGQAATHLQHGSGDAPTPRTAAPRASTPRTPAAAAAAAPASVVPEEEVEFMGLRFQHDGTLIDRDGWSRELAEALAPTVGVEILVDAHWVVIDFARAEYAATGKSPNIRRLTQGSGVDTRTLYTLFPQAPGRAVARIAGLPKPVGCL